MGVESCGPLPHHHCARHGWSAFIRRYHGARRTPRVTWNLLEASLSTSALARTAPEGRRSSLHPLLFAAYPVLFLWSQNLGETDPRDVVLPLVALPVMAAVVTWLAGRVLGDPRRGALIVTPLAFGLLMYGHVDRIVRQVVAIPGLVQQVGWAFLVLIAVVAAIRLGTAAVAAIDRALVRVGAILILVALVLIVPFQIGALGGRVAPTSVQPQSDVQIPASKQRDVYWLVFDRYGSDRSLELQYGVENDLSPWLTDHGFTVLADSHANYVRTVLSMSTTLNMAPLTDLAAREGPDSADLAPVNDWLQAPLVARQFKALGYRYDHIGSWWAPTHDDGFADANYVADGPNDFVAALYDETALPPLFRRLHLDPLIDDARERAFDHNTVGLDALDGLVDDPGPKFVLGHFLVPHPPSVFDTDGSFMTDAEAATMSGNERYRRQLAYTNTRIRAFIERVQALPADQQPIVIVQADEGPWSAPYSAERKTTFDWEAATPEDLEIKFGIMNAWYVPDGTDLGLYPTMSAINTFPVLFSRYFGLDYPLLPDTVYTSATWLRPYDLTDITGRLPSLQ